ncbi:hypothetical protein PSTG_14106 [Puccinia striiformis f. sp. tritici PST-78]|uniref:Uncharacterized protein n=1 Tax=Puccinia striiformis f. sp. tritici PST-78 TaxID=1165861 RepID=A0A0L0UZQ9_9BASI|nr:hypothetical protein PSTG_14106 [Puccinia striiformis f. sp. tritici PST-78]
MDTSTDPPPQPPNYVTQSIAIHQMMLVATKSHFPTVLPALLWSACCLEFISAFLYTVSAIPAIRKEGFWLFQTEGNGMVRPNTRIIIPICVVLYVICDASTLMLLLRDLRSKSLTSALTCGMGLSTYPILLFTGWTRIWNVLRAVPLTKHGLTTARQSNGEVNRTYFRPRTINVLSVLFYTVPLLYGGAPIYLLIKGTGQINQTFKEYNHNYSRIMSGSVGSKTILKYNLKAIEQMSSMLHTSQKVLSLSRLLAFGYLIYIVTSWLIMSFGYIRILQAVKYQIQTFKQSLDQRKAIAVDRQKLEASTKSDSISVTRSYDSSSCGSSISTARSYISATFLNLLPTLRPNPDFLEKPSQSTRTTESRTGGLEQWEIANRTLIQFQLKALRRYRVNLYWQMCSNSLILMCFFALNFIVCFNLLGVPTNYSVSDLSWLTITWASLSWVVSLGIPMGLVSFIVSLSPPVTTLRENTERVDEKEDW